MRSSQGRPRLWQREEVSYLELSRPVSLGDAEWSAVLQLVDRILRAHSDRDWSLVIGSAKELCEAVAKQVVEARGEVIPRSVSYDSILTMAHRLLDRQPGEGLAADPPVRDLTTATKRIAIEVGRLRSTHGTGHGRVVRPDATAEHAELALDAAVLWCRWALRRLDVIVEGRAIDLLQDLREGTFRRGDLRRRLLAADLPGLPQEDQRRLGVAVGRRSSRRTVNVLEEGFKAAATEGPWTQAYREGLIEGAFIGEDGYVRVTGPSAAAAIEILTLMEPEVAIEAVERIDSRMFEAVLSYAVDTSELMEAKETIERAAERIGPVELSLSLKLFASKLDPNRYP
jgi:hypothetical protein